jgi:hypothetical protein
MKLEDLPEGTRIFVDANILIYHFSGVSLECQAFLQRCESGQLEAFTGVHIVLEVAHRLTCQASTFISPGISHKGFPIGMEERWNMCDIFAVTIGKPTCTCRQ